MGKFVFLMAILSANILVTRVAAAADLAEEKKQSAAYLQKMLEEPNAKEIEKGIVIRPIFESGTGKFPVISDTVKVSYHLVDREGKLIDESISADELAVFPLSKLIKCWQIAIPQISIGSFYKVTCASDFAYGDKGTSDGAIKGGAALTFRLTVFGVE